MRSVVAGAHYLCMRQLEIQHTTSKMELNANRLVFITFLRTYELKVHGGTPFESDVELDPARNMKSSGGFVPAILRINQTPRLYVRLLGIPRARKAIYDLIPPKIITSALYAQPLGCFRHLVGLAFLRGRHGLPLECKHAFRFTIIEEHFLL